MLEGRAQSGSAPRTGAPPEGRDEISPWETEPEAVVATLYKLLLGREPDPEGLRVHTNALLANQLTPQELARTFVESEEFAGRAAARGN